jgi:hypothetical protein
MAKTFFSNLSIFSRASLVGVTHEGVAPFAQAHKLRSVSGQTQHLLSYVVGTKEMVSFARRPQRQNGRSFHAGISERGILKRVMRGQRADKEMLCECSLKMHCGRICLYIGSSRNG